MIKNEVKMKRVTLMLAALTTLVHSQAFKWKFETGNRIESSPAVGRNGTVYVRSIDDYLYAVNPDGSEKWHYPADWRSYQEISPAIGPDGTVYVTTDQHILAINPLNGSFKWSYTTDLFPKTPAFGSDGTIYLSDTNKLYALTPEGEEKWWIDYPTVELTAPVIDSEGTIYVGAVGSVYNWFGILKIDPQGNIISEFETATSVYTPLAIGFGNVLYFGTQDGDFNALNPDGTLKWRITPEYPVQVPPAVGPDSTVYIGDNGYNFYAIDYNGTIKWNYPIRVSYSTPAIGADGTIYVEEAGKSLYAFSPQGDVLWTYYYGGGTNSSPAIAPDGTIYLSGWYDNSLHAITSPSLGLAQTPWPRYRHDNQHSGRVQYILPSVSEKPLEDSGIDLEVRLIGKSLRVSYSLREGEDGMLRVYDSAGRLVKEQRVEGNGVVEFPDTLPVGVYFVRLVSQGQQRIAKTLLFK